MTNENTYVTALEAAEITGFSRARVHQFCRGYTDKKQGKVYKHEPKLKLGRDWRFNPATGQVEIKRASLSKLKKKSN